MLTAWRTAVGVFSRNKCNRPRALQSRRSGSKMPTAIRISGHQCANSGGQRRQQAELGEQEGGAQRDGDDRGDEGSRYSWRTSMALCGASVIATPLPPLPDATETPRGCRQTPPSRRDQSSLILARAAAAFQRCCSVAMKRANSTRRATRRDGRLGVELLGGTRLLHRRGAGRSQLVHRRCGGFEARAHRTTASSRSRGSPARPPWAPRAAAGRCVVPVAMQRSLPA